MTDSKRSPARVAALRIRDEAFKHTEFVAGFNTDAAEQIIREAYAGSAMDSEIAADIAQKVKDRLHLGDVGRVIIAGIAEAVLADSPRLVAGGASPRCPLCASTDLTLYVHEGEAYVHCSDTQEHGAIPLESVADFAQFFSVDAGREQTLMLDIGLDLARAKAYIKEGDIVAANVVIGYALDNLEALKKG